MKTLGKIYLLGLTIALSQACGSAEMKSAKEDYAAEPLEASKTGQTRDEGQVAGNANFKSDDKRSESTIDTAKMNYVASFASRIGKIDSIKKFIRTADIKFKVKNVEQSTYKLEDIIHHFDGFVINTNLNCKINYTESHRVKEDSLLERKHFTVENSITFRVPKTLLDTTLKQIVSQIDFLDHRIITAEDITFEEIKNKMHQKRFGKFQQRITKATDNSKKTGAVVDAENDLYEKEGDADDSALNDLIRNDKVEYSTVTMYIYQDEKISDEVVFSQPNFQSYKPSFGSEFVSSLKFGWTIVEQLFLLLVKLWPLIIIGFAIFFGIKKFVFKKV
jgi:hypothetical protein